MSILASLTPLNLKEAETLFRQDPHRNPQFIYSRVFSSKILTLHGLPQPAYFDLAQAYLQKVTPTLSVTEKERLLSPREIATHTRALFAQLGLDRPIIHWQHIPSIAKRRDDTIIFNQNVRLSAKHLNGILAHEVQTHLLRSYNQNLQTLPKSKSSQYARTEEGLAALNSKFVQNKVDFTSSCYRYLVCHWAQTQSFVEIFQRLINLPGFNFDRAWYYTLRAKRGLIDTAQPGGYTKDIVYLEGNIQVLSWLLKKDHRLADLYLGKISLVQVPVYQASAVREGLIYPTFIDQTSQYQQFLQACKQQLVPLLSESIRLDHNN